MRMAPEFDKANEIYFRLGIIYKQQQKFNLSLEVGQNRRWMIFPWLTSPVFQIHCQRSSATFVGRRYLVPNWSCS